jgi:2-(1,2-epoxy-1,2-dihydrophenyl)acetyl-CoA isomerase
MNDFSTVRIDRDGPVAVVTLNRPDSLNSFNGELRREFLAAARAVNADPAIRVVVLTGEGRAFCAGADLSEGLSPDDGGGHATEAMLNDEYKPAVLAITQSRKPWIAAVNGAAAGIGSAYALACDLSVMGEGAYLYQAFVAIGLVPDGGATWHLARTLGPLRAFDMMTSGEKIPAARCVELGLANRVVADDALVDSAVAWANELAGKAPLALEYIKKSLAFAMENDLPSVIANEASLQHSCVDSDDAKEGVMAFLEKRQANWSGR